jgi:hypothetical protein
MGLLVVILSSDFKIYVSREGYSSGERVSFWGGWQDLGIISNLQRLLIISKLIKMLMSSGLIDIPCVIRTFNDDY